MPDHTVSIAQIHLARSPLRLILPSAILLVLAAVAGAAGVSAGSALGAALVVAASALALIALYLAVMLFSVRIDVEVATLYVRWIGGSRRYSLARGAVTRVALRGEGAAALRARFGALGWALGVAVLRDAERIEIVRLAPTRSLILVPIDQGRLGIAPVSERALVAALGAAARVQQRLDEVTSHVPTMPAREGPPVRPASRYVEGRLLTGIERARLEERLAAERAAAIAAAQAERAAMKTAAQAPAIEPEPVLERPEAAPEVVVLDERPRVRTRFTRPPWTERPRDAAAMLLAAAPLVGALGLWIAIAVTGSVPTADAQLRPAILALALAAAGAVGVLAARTWFPRLIGLVSLTSLISLVLLGRALLG